MLVGLQPGRAAGAGNKLEEAGATLDAAATRLQALLDAAAVESTAPASVRHVATECWEAAWNLATRVEAVREPARSTVDLGSWLDRTQLPPVSLGPCSIGVPVTPRLGTLGEDGRFSSEDGPEPLAARVATHCREEPARTAYLHDLASGLLILYARRSGGTDGGPPPTPGPGEPRRGTPRYRALVAKLRKLLGYGPGNLGVAGRLTEAEADWLGRQFVGPGYRSGRARTGAPLYISEDGLRQYRGPDVKDATYTLTGRQANFEQRSQPTGAWTSNGHVDVTP